MIIIVIYCELWYLMKEEKTAGQAPAEALVRVQTQPRFTPFPVSRAAHGGNTGKIMERKLKKWKKPASIS